MATGERRSKPCSDFPTSAVRAAAAAATAAVLAHFTYLLHHRETREL